MYILYLLPRVNLPLLLYSIHWALLTRLINWQIDKISICHNYNYQICQLQSFANLSKTHCESCKYFMYPLHYLRHNILIDNHMQLWLHCSTTMQYIILHSLIAGTFHFRSLQLHITWLKATHYKLQRHRVTQSDGL